MSENKPRAVDRAQQMYTDEATKAVSGIHDSLVVDKLKARLPEPLFVENFLPYFSREKEITPESQVIPNWIAVAGTPMTEVDVINAEGEVLFTVPSLFNTNVLEIANRPRGQALADIYQQYELRNNNVPAAARNFLGTALDKKQAEITSGESKQNETNARWNEIFARYKLIKEDAPQSNLAAQAPNDDVEYG